MLVRRKGTKLAYSRRTHDVRIYGKDKNGEKCIMTPHFLDIIARRCVTDINEARKRINIIRGKYTYVPSKEYTQALKRYTLKGTTYKKSDYE